MSGPRAFADVLPIVEPLPKPRKVGLTEIRDRAVSLEQTKNIVSVFGDYIDTVKWTMGGMRLVSAAMVKEKNSYLLENGIGTSTGGFLERMLLGGGSRYVPKFLDECKRLDFTIVEVSSGTTILPLADKLELIKAVQAAGFKAKPEVMMAYSPSGPSPVSTPANADMIIYETQKCLDAGAWLVTIEEDGVFRYVDEWAYDLVFRLVRTVGLERLFFESSDPAVINWLIKTFGADVNIFIDSSDIMTLAGLRAGIWGRDDTWGRIAAYRPSEVAAQ
jgi:phosphosulfolactate synthase (CoM biosynthesis protein A)